tara:strand:- start:1152 stop:2192 length:1041 start_codon:yes stop_codon:yes gene_type:complete
MRILKIDKRNHTVRVMPEIHDDLWHLERVLEKGDLVSGSTDRKIKPKEQGGKMERKKLFLDVEVDKIDFHRETGNLRITGLIRGGKPAELIEMGASHSLELELGKDVNIKKKELKGFQIERLEKAQKATKQGKVLLVVLDDERADLAFLKEFALEKKGTIRSGKSGKRFESVSTENDYFKQILDRVVELKADRIIFAGPGFTKDSFKKWVEEKKFKTSSHFVATNSTGITGLNELVKGSAIKNIVQEMQLVKEIRLVETLFEELGKDNGLIAYGLEEVNKAIDFGAVKDLLVCDDFMLENREESEGIMQKTEKMKGNVHLLDAGNDAGKKLASLGRVAALLRFKIG